MNNLRILCVCAVLVATFMVAVPAIAAQETVNTTLVETAQEDGNFSVLVEALNITGLNATLSDQNATYTVFAPNDDVFFALPGGIQDFLLSHADFLANVLQYHVVTGDINSTQLAALDNITTVLGENLTISNTTEGLFVNDALVVRADIVASNGRIHEIDAFLKPSFVPTANIVELAVADGNFTNLTAALNATGLNQTLSDENATFTVFAPTDEAFSAIPEEDLNALLNDTEKLTEILLYHVADGIQLQSDLEMMDNITSLQGDTLNLTNTTEGLMVNDANVVAADILASNGVIHAIDMVLIPPVEEANITADFQADVTEGSAPLEVLFTDLSTGTNISTWQWDFGDGEMSAEQSPVHEYMAAGIYTVSLTVTDMANNTATEMKPDFITVL